MNAEKFLDHVSCVLTDRMKMYGDARESFERIARRWSDSLGEKITAEQAIIMMMELKLCRIQNSSNLLDSLTDLVGYAALLAEVISENGNVFLSPHPLLVNKPKSDIINY